MALPDKVIDDLVNDPEFLSLSESEQDSLVQELDQELTGTIPQTENFLQKAIRVATHDVPAVGAGLISPLPEISRQLSKAPISGPMQFASGMAEKEPAFDIPHATTEIGRKAEAVAPYVPLVIGVTKLAISGGKGIGSLFGEKAARDEFMNVVYESGKQISSKIDDLFTSARENYKTVLSRIDPRKINVSDIIDAIDDTLKSKGSKVAEYMSPQEKNLLGVKNKLLNLGKTTEAVPEIIDPLTNKVVQKATEATNILPDLGRSSELKYIPDEVYKAASGRADLQGEFLHNYGNLLKDKGAGELTKANAQYKRAYEAYDSSKKLTVGKVRAAGKRTIGSKEIADLKGLEKEIGVNVLEKSIKAGSKVSRARTAKKVAKVGGGLTVAAGGLSWLKGLIKK